MPERVVHLAEEVSVLTRDRLAQVARVARTTKVLAINAAIEAAHAGTHGVGFAVVAKEVGSVADTVGTLSTRLDEQLAPLLAELATLGESLVEEVRGSRLADLALNAVELIDRNLYERSCDVRWWATDSAFVEACEVARQPDRSDAERRRTASFAARRLSVILSSYTVYLDLWVADAHGRVIAHGRPERFAGVLGSDVSGQAWFQEAMASATGSDYAVADVDTAPALGGATVATYAAAIRAGGAERGEPLGVLGIFFDFAPQAHDIVTGVRVAPEDRERTRVMLVDAQQRVLASSDGAGVLVDRIDLDGPGGQPVGCFTRADGEMVGFARTPGYETYEGLGWSGVIVQRPRTTPK